MRRWRLLVVVPLLAALMGCSSEAASDAGRSDGNPVATTPVSIDQPVAPPWTPASGCVQPADGDVVADVSLANALAKEALPAKRLTYSSIGGTWTPPTCSVQIIVYGVSDSDRSAVDNALESLLGVGFAVTATSARIAPLAQTGY